jgi:glycosyltransferase involved in cell wall biosynthesis
LPVRHYHIFLTGAIGVSREVCDYYISGCHLSADNVDWIPYGVKANPDAPVVNKDPVLKMVYAGRIEEEQKRVSDLITIAKTLSEQKINFALQVVGDGSAMPQLKESLKAEIGEKKIKLWDGLIMMK